MQRLLRIRSGFVLGVVFTLFAAWLVTWLMFVRMPGSSSAGPAGSLSESELDLQVALARHVEKLGRGIGARSTEDAAGLEAALAYLEAELEMYGYAPRRLTYAVGLQEVSNLEVEIPGRSKPDEIIVVGAHYDGVGTKPAANDNGSGVASLLVLAERLRERSLERTVRFVFFVNEEPPHFQGESMGSLVYARACRKREDNIVAMWSLETLGYYSSEEGSQSYPADFLYAFYPKRGDFVAFVGDTSARSLVQGTVASFREHSDFPSEGVALPGLIDGVGWSDHWSFSEVGYPALMITDTAIFRYPHYHTDEDLPEHVKIGDLARVVDGLARVLLELAAG